MRNAQKRSATRPSTRPDHAESSNRSTRSGPSPSPLSSSSSPPANAFSQRFLLQASRLEEISGSGPSRLTGGTFWAGPCEVEPVRMRHGDVWAVVRRGESLMAGGRAVAVARNRSDTLLIAAVLPGLATPNRLSIGEKPKRLGLAIHDGSLCVGHLSRPEGQIVDHLHVARTLVGNADSFALAVAALGREEIPIFGRALMGRIARD